LRSGRRDSYILTVAEYWESIGGHFRRTWVVHDGYGQHIAHNVTLDGSLAIVAYLYSALLHWERDWASLVLS